MALYLIVAFLFDFRRVPNDPDSLMELTELVHKGERRGIFTDKMPASIHRVIQAENLQFVKNRDVYNQEYFKFVKNFVAKNSVSMVLKYQILARL